MFFTRVIKNLKLFKKEFILNILFSALYALFSAIAFFSLMPMLEVLFNGTNQTIVKPDFDSSLNLGSFLENWLNYQVVVFAGQDNQKAILFVVFVVIFLFFLKNVFNYFALFFSTIMRNGVIRIIRKQIFENLIVLPMSFFSKNKKGDVISRITSDVIEVQNSYLSIIEIFIRDPLSIIFTIAAMFIISLELTLFVIVFIPVSAFIIFTLDLSDLIMRFSFLFFSSCNFFQPNGSTLLPWFKIVAYAPTKSRRVASDVPSAIAGPLFESENNPNIFPNSDTFDRPTASEILTAGMFKDSENALVNVTSPLKAFE